MKQGKGRVTPRDGALTKTQRRSLESLRGGPRAYNAADTTYVAMEKQGFVRRLGPPRKTTMRANPVIDWEMTPVGKEMLGKDA